MISYPSHLVRMLAESMLVDFPLRKINRYAVVDVYKTMRSLLLWRCDLLKRQVPKCLWMALFLRYFAALNGIKIGDKTLTLRRANQGTKESKPEQESILLHAQQQIAFQMNMLQSGPVATTVVCLTHVVTEDENFGIFIVALKA